MRVGTLTQLWRYPVKSMGGEPLPSAVLGVRGIPGDRGWAVYDETRGGITGAKRLPPLRACRARYPSEPLEGAASPPADIVLPDGARVTSDSPEAARRLCELLGRPVSLRALGPAGSDAAPRVTLAGESPETVRAVMGVLPEEPMPDLSDLSSERLWLLRQGNFFDAFPIHLLTHATLRTLSETAPESAWDPRRFRANLLVDTDGGPAYPELSWIGRRLRVGSAVLEVVMGCPRCVMVTQPVEDLPADHRIMRTLVRETKHTAGIYAAVVQPGEARSGDEVALFDSR